MGLRKTLKSLRFVYQAISSRPPRVAYIGGWAGNSNLGDEAVYTAMRAMFPSGCFIDYPAGLNMPFSRRFLSRVRLGILAGGTMIGPKIGTITHAMPLLTGCPDFIVFGSGVMHPSQKPAGPKFYDWPLWRDKWREILKSCRYVGVRGPLSAEVLADGGSFTPEVIGDPVLFFAGDKPGDSGYQQKTIGLNIGRTSGLLWGDADNITAQYVELASAAKKAGWLVKWFVVWPNDFPLTRKVALVSGTDKYIYRVYHKPSIFLKLVKQVSVFVGMKLHAVALATCAYVPSIMIEYQTKCKDYMMAIGQEQFCIHPEGLISANIWEKVRFFESNQRRSRDDLFYKISELRNKQIVRAAGLSASILK